MAVIVTAGVGVPVIGAVRVAVPAPLRMPLAAVRMALGAGLAVLLWMQVPTAAGLTLIVRRVVVHRGEARLGSLAPPYVRRRVESSGLAVRTERSRVDVAL